MAAIAYPLENAAAAGASWLVKAGEPMPLEKQPEDPLGPRLISEAITPIAESFDPAAMSRGEPGLPSGFLWRGREFLIESCKKSWKVSRLDSTGTEFYRRRHYYELEMTGGACWVVYLLRQPPPGRAGRVQSRWYLYTVS